MDSLSAKEIALLDLIQEKPELQPAFFRKVRGEKWFAHLSSRGFFSETGIPAPKESKEPGYFTVPRWHAIQYLVNSLKENPGCLSSHYDEIVQIIGAATEYAKNNGFSNYQVWWQFSEIVCHIPPESIPTQFGGVIDYWLDDSFNRGLVSEILGVELVPSLLDNQSPPALDFALRVLNLVFKTAIVERDESKSNLIATIRSDEYHLKKVIDASAYKSGAIIGWPAVEVFQTELRSVVEGLLIDSYSYIWQSAIEDHEQNEYQRDVENLIVRAFRESLHGYLDANPGAEKELISRLLDDGLNIFKRIAIYLAEKYEENIDDVGALVLRGNWLDDGVRHEMWHFINSCYGNFTEERKGAVLAAIGSIEVLDENNEVNEAASSYGKAIWLASIKDYGGVELGLYNAACAIAKAVPQNPDFLTYMSVGDYSVENESPYSADQLASMSDERLLNALADASTKDSSKLAGLAKILKQVIRDDPMRYWQDLDLFSRLDPAFVHAVIEAFSELWDSNKSLPWDAVWKSLLGFIRSTLTAPEFWLPDRFVPRQGLLANSNWVVGSVARLFVSGVKDDKHAVSSDLHDPIRDCIVLLLDCLEGAEFKDGQDAVSIASNSPRGLCLEALINLALRECRLEDERNGRVLHPDSWSIYGPIFEKEIERLDQGVFEFSAIFGLYFLNFKYLSIDWVQANGVKVFGQENSLRWICGIQGLGYLTRFDKDVYEFFRSEGNGFSVLDNDKVGTEVKRKVIQYIAMGYLLGLDDLNEEGGQAFTLVQRFCSFELSEFINFIHRSKKELDQDVSIRVREFIYSIVSRIDQSDLNDRKIGSNLSKLLNFEKEIDESNREAWETLAKLVGENHNEYEFLKNLERLSEVQPYEANNLWQCMIMVTPADYPSDPIKKMFERLVAKGNDGILAARETASAYLRHDVDRPNVILKEILEARA